MDRLFSFNGWVTLQDVTFDVKATTKEEALIKLREGKFSVITDVGDITVWQADESSCTEN